MRRITAFTLVAGLAAVGVLIQEAGPVAAAGVTAAYVEGEPGTYVVGERSIDFATVVPTTVLDSGQVTFSLASPGHNFFLQIAPPPGEAWRTGAYEQAERSSFRSAGRPGLDLFGDGAGCNTVTGRFVVDQVEFNPNGDLLAFAARFEFHCEGATAAVFGAIAYNSTVPYRTRSLSSNALDFGAVARGEMAETSLAIANNGPASLTVNSVGITNSAFSEYSISSDGCSGRIVPARGSCEIGVRFTATATVGATSIATLTIFDDLAPVGGTGRDVALKASIKDPSGEFTPITPKRIFDTRDGTGGRRGALGPRESYAATVLGVGGVPGSGVSAVVLNATATQATADTFVTVWPTGGERPNISSLNLRPGRAAPNLVTVAVGAGGKVSVYNQSGSTEIILDVVGYYSSTSGPSGSRFTSIDPVRMFDTRDGTGGVPAIPVGEGRSLNYAPADSGVVPADATAVVMNVTVTRPTANGYLTVYPGDVSPPVVSNLNFTPGRTVPNLVTVRVGDDGTIGFFNAYGATHVIADVVGYYSTAIEGESGRFVGLTPKRIFDTRPASFPLPPNTYDVVPVAGRSGVPSYGAASAVLNITVTGSTTGGYVSAFPDDACFLPDSSNLNFGVGETIPNAAIVRLSTYSGCVNTAGAIDVYNAYGFTHIIVDVFGYFTT